MTSENICRKVVSLVPEARRSAPRLVYLGTATYDVERFGTRQTSGFVALGCEVVPLNVAVAATTPEPDAIKDILASADIVLVSGGNSLYAIDRWRALGIDAHLADAAARGCVMTGGSAGALCWFDGGHSDSADPATYRAAMLAAEGAVTVATAAPIDESAIGGDAPRAWTYIRINGLGLLPGLVCPHYDVTQSNGVLRAVDFVRVHATTQGEVGIGIDHWAAIVLDGEGGYEIIAADGKVAGGATSLTWEDQTPTTTTTTAAATDGRVHVPVARPVGTVGRLADLLREPFSPPVNDDAALAACRAGNPQPI